jgi:hypothetical protein
MGPSPSRPARGLPLAITLILLATAIAGCMHPDDANGNGNGARVPGNGDRQNTWENPYPFDILFDGDRAYAHLLWQIYEDPENKQGPRYRIPGTETHQEVAQGLHSDLQGYMQQIGGQTTFHNFTGSEYYELDLSAVERFFQQPGGSRCDQDEQIRDRNDALEFMNIVARTNTTHHGFLIGAHWDSQRYATNDPDPERRTEPVLGADDGASGTAAVVELARVFAEAPIDIPLTFILFDGEDGFHHSICHPLAGSLHYAQNLSPEEKETIHGLILLDLIGNETARFYREGHSTNGWPYGDSDAVRSAWLVDHIWQTAAELNVTAFVNQSTGNVYDDHIPFLQQGIYAIDIINFASHTGRSFPAHWDTTFDDHTNVSGESLEQVGVVVEAALRRFAEDPTLITGSAA